MCELKKAVGTQQAKSLYYSRICERPFNVTKCIFKLQIVAVNETNSDETWTERTVSALWTDNLILFIYIFKYFVTYSSLIIIHQSSVEQKSCRPEIIKSSWNVLGFVHMSWEKAEISVRQWASQALSEISAYLSWLPICLTEISTFSQSGHVDKAL